MKYVVELDEGNPILKEERSWMWILIFIVIFVLSHSSNVYVIKVIN